MQKEKVLIFVLKIFVHFFSFYSTVNICEKADKKSSAKNYGNKNYDEKNFNSFAMIFNAKVKRKMLNLQLVKFETCSHRSFYKLT